MVTAGEGGHSSDGGSGFSSDSEASDTHIDSLVDDILGKLSIYPPYNRETMTIKNRKFADRAKSDRQTDAELCATNSRHGHGYKPYAFHEERREGILHRPRIRSSHQHESSLSENTSYQPINHFSRPQVRVPVSQPPEGLSSSFDFRGPPRDPTCDPSVLPVAADKENGNNSEDEYYTGQCTGAHVLRNSPIQADDTNLEKLLVEKKGWKIIKVQADGACLFRSVSHQIFGDEEKHDVVRNQVVDYMLKNREHFSPYITEDFDHYVNRKRDVTCYGNHIEIQAIAELYNRPVEIYYDSVDPINVFHAEYSKEFPIRLSYHGRVHYNSIVDPFNPSFGYGLGMPNYQPSLAEPDLIAKAIDESEATQLEETMLRDKLAETEHSELERCIEAQVLRESYYDYLRQIKVPVRHNIGGSSSQLPLGALAPAVRTSAVDVASSSTTSSWAPIRLPAPSLPSPSVPSSSSHYQLPPNLNRMDEDSLVAMVMEQSRNEYLESLRKRCVSPSGEIQEPHTSTSSGEAEKPDTTVISTLPTNGERS